MAGTAMKNAMRSAVVVAGALSFGYLTLVYGSQHFLKQQSEGDLRQPLFPPSTTKDKFDD